MPNATKVAERLIAHARLCQQIAKQSWSEDDAARLEKLADECLRAASDLDVSKIDRAPN